MPYARSTTRVAGCTLVTFDRAFRTKSVPLVLLEEAYHGRFEEELADLAGPGLAHLGRADVEAHVRVGDGVLDFALRAGKATDVDDGMVGMVGHGEIRRKVRHSVELGLVGAFSIIFGRRRRQ